MPRYYFPSWDGDLVAEDWDGVELQGPEEARALAVVALAELARDVLPHATGPRTLKLCVLDGQATPAFEFRLTFEASSRRVAGAATGPGEDG